MIPPMPARMIPAAVAEPSRLRPMSNGISSTSAATNTMITVSSKIPNSRQKLPDASRHDRRSALTGPSCSSTTTGAARLNRIQAVTSAATRARNPRMPQVTASALMWVRISSTRIST